MELLLFHSHCFCNGHIYKGKKNKSNLTFLFPRSGLQDIFREAEVTICRVHIRQLICGLRFMRDIIAHNQPQIPEMYFSDCLWPNYSTEQIDEVKTELARHILYFAS
ncbi:uncharacterized protein LOC110708335 isoform X3 [Chenopodium quinoa]|uniref:uncharacterized protein LOC110708335 isoform X3 n=1 Tax=Chenopodium quinoa TaxID=63459 RepID=UPI000B78668C|nr:uncharacterized protein LOC110708335 isoform X3 [Chenopodium quinoa]